MIGQLSDDEFKNIFSRKSMFEYHVDYINKTAWVKYGKSTINYYKQHNDNSWTNYDCKTI